MKRLLVFPDMLIKLFFMIMLVYYGVRAVGRLLHAVRGDTGTHPPRPMENRSAGGDSNSEGRKGVEDARWRDV